MNHIEVQGGGFPGTSLTWRFIRDMIKEVHGLAVAMAGNNCIVTGCELVNGQVSPGIVIIEGEAVPFAGGELPQNTTLEIAQNIMAADYFQDEEGDGQADSIDTYFTRYARFGDGGVDLFDLRRLEPLREVGRRLPPKQTALPFWGAVNTIPKGWQLCDGSNGTPDLRGMFIAGYDPADTDHNAPGKTGGSSKHTLTEAEMPSHKHSGATSSTGGHRHSYDVYPAASRGEAKSDGYWRVGQYPETKQTSWEGTHSHSLYINNTGGGQPHENRPKYYTMAWIAYVG